MRVLSGPFLVSISLTVKRNSSVTYEYTGRMIDGTFINKGILHEKPNPDSFSGMARTPATLPN